LRNAKQLTIAGLVEAVGAIAMRRENGDFVAAVLETDGGIDDKALGSPNAQVGMEEDDALRLGGHG
jgi:hypothetical protein